MISANCLIVCLGIFLWVKLECSTIAHICKNDVPFMAYMVMAYKKICICHKTLHNHKILVNYKDHQCLPGRQSLVECHRALSLTIPFNLFFFQIINIGTTHVVVEKKQF